MRARFWQLQGELGLRVSSVQDIGLSALKFYSSWYSQYQGNDNNHGKEEITEEDLLRDDKAEYFDGDSNNSDRFTS